MTQPLAAGDSVGRYTVIRPLGQGGMGLVFEVKHQTLGTRAALKLLWTGQAINRELAARFLTEARAGGAIEHPGVVRVLEYDVLPSGVPYLLMEFLPGETLSQRLQRGRHLGLAALPILQQIADTLAAVHARGIVHRDLKPGNVMLVPDSAVPGGERVKILDFGIAKILAKAKTEADLVPEVQTADGALLGTPAFMAPELWQSSGRADEKTDVYALGVMAYQMLAGRELFEVSDPIALMYQHATRRPTPLSTVVLDIPAPLSDLVADMLQKEQAQRPTMAAVSQALQGLAAALGEGARQSRVLPAAGGEASGPASVGPASVASVGPGIALAPADARTLDGQLRREESSRLPQSAAQNAMPQPSQILSPVGLPEDATLRPPAPAVVEAAGVALDAATQRREAPVVRRTLPLLLVALLLLVLALVALRG